MFRETRILSSTLEPVYDPDGSVDHWYGSVVIETWAREFDRLGLEELAGRYAPGHIEVSEWTVETLGTGLFRLSPLEWKKK